MVAGVSFLHSNEVSTTIMPAFSPMLLPCMLHGSVGCMALPPSKLSKGSSILCNNIINTSDLDPLRVNGEPDLLCVSTAELLSSSGPVFAAVSLRRCPLRFHTRWISIWSYGGQAMGAAAGHDGGEAGASPWSEADNDELGDGVPPELALRLVRIGAIVGVLHIGNRRRRLGGGL